MDLVQEMRGANIIVDKCSDIQPDDEVLIVSDWNSSNVAEKICASTKERGADVYMFLMDEVPYSNAEPPEGLADLLKSYNTIFAVLQNTISHSKAVTEANDEQTKYIAVSKFTSEQLKSGALYADFESISPKVERLTDMLTEADEAHITSPQGTDLTLSLNGSVGKTVNSIKRPGTDHIAPGGLEATISPVEGSANGTIIVDGAIPDLDIGVLNDEITMNVADGAVTSISGGKEARKIRRIWEKFDDPSVYNIAQLAVGMNPAVREFDDNFITAHSRYGNVHFGIGTSESLLGGSVRASAHFDGMLEEASLTLDGELVLKDGETFVI